MQTILEVTNLEMFEAERMNADGYVELSRERRAAIAEKTKALKG
jgi:hypothetical protein